MHKYPDMLSLKCLLSAISVPNRRPWSDNPAGSSTQETADQSTEREQAHVPAKSRAIIMPCEESGWTPTQLAPFIKRIAADQSIDGNVWICSSVTWLILFCVTHSKVHCTRDA